MMAPAGQRFIVILLAAASLLTTALIALTVANQRRPAAPDQPVARAGVVHGPTAVEQPPAAPVAADLPILYPAPDFTLIERSEKPVALSDLRGKVWVANFVFTRCGTVCPMMGEQMSWLQGQLRQTPAWSSIRLLSFSVDPQHDTPAVLRDYADRYRAEAGQWLFLTGPRQTVWDLVRTGFRLPVEETATDAAMPILHSEKFVLVDAAGRIRGYYDATDAEARERLLGDVARLVATAKP